MENNINGLSDELEFTTKLLKELKIKASKPSYMSESMIARMEGFKLPFSNEAEPRKFLGNSKPTSSIVFIFPTAGGGGASSSSLGVIITSEVTLATGTIGASSS